MNEKELIKELDDYNYVISRLEDDLWETKQKRESILFELEQLRFEKNN